MADDAQKQEPCPQEQHTIILKRAEAHKKGTGSLMDHIKEVAMGVCGMGSAHLTLSEALADLTKGESNGELVKYARNDPDAVERFFDEQLLPAMQEVCEACETTYQKGGEAARELRQLRHKIRVQEGTIVRLASTNQQQARNINMARAEW